MGLPVFQDRRGFGGSNAGELIERLRIGSIDIDGFRSFRRESLRVIVLPRLSPDRPGLAFGYEKTGAMTHCIHAACKQTEDGQRYPRYPFMHRLLSDP